jgi:multicomponent Na+:H+ antiporter subunit B
LKTFNLLVVVLFGALLIFASDDFPQWGSSETPASQSRVSEYYIRNTYDETLVPNIVTAVLADYRGYDTLFETVVVFTAGIAIFSILGIGAMTEKKNGIAPPARVSIIAPRDLIVRVSCRVLVPVIQLFALYVLAHGHHSPGGGFQGGVIMAASFILMELSSDLRAHAVKFTNQIAILLGIVGIMIYGGWGAACVLLGGHFLDYSYLAGIIPDSADMARSHSIFIVEIGVAFTVSSIMVLIFRQLSTGGYTIEKEQ